VFVNNLTRALYQQLLSQFQANYLADLPAGTPVEIRLPFWAYLDPENIHYRDPQESLSEEQALQILRGQFFNLDPAATPKETDEADNTATVWWNPEISD